MVLCDDTMKAVMHLLALRIFTAFRTPLTPNAVAA